MKALKVFGRTTLLIAILGVVAVTCWKTRNLGLAEATQLWSAIGTVGAVVIALALALLQRSRDRHEEARRAAAAAVLLSHDAYQLRAALSAVVDHAERVKQNKIAYGHWLSGVSHRLKNHPVLIADKYLPFVGDLPPRTLFELSVADLWLRNFKNRHAFGEAVTLAEVIGKFDSMMDEIELGYEQIVLVTNRLHPLSQVSGPPPWKAYTPSWAVPQASE